MEVMKDFRTMVRQLDFEKAGERIQNRKALLAEKMGEKGKTRDDFVIKPFDSHSKFLSFVSFVQAASDYDDFQKNYIITDEAYKDYRLTKDNEYIGDIVNFGMKALYAVGKKNNEVETVNRINILNYRVGMSCIRLGNYKEGIERMEAFLSGIDTLDKRLEEESQEQTAFVKKINKESEDEKKAVIMKQKIITWLAIIAALVSIFVGASAMVAEIQASTTAPIATQAGLTQWANSLATLNTQVSMSTLGLSSTGLLSAGFEKGLSRDLIDEQAMESLREEIAKLMTHQYLKVARYLDRFEMLDYFSELGKAFEIEGKKEEALDQYLEAAAVIEQQRSSILTENQRINFFSQVTNVYNNIIALAISMNKPEDALVAAESAKSRAFIDILGSTKIKLKNESQDREHNEFSLTKEEVSMLTRFQPTLDQMIEAVTKDASGVVINKIGNKNPDFIDDIEIMSLSAVHPLSADEIKKMASADILFIEYYVSANMLYILTVGTDGVRVKHVPVRSDEIENNKEKLLIQIEKREKSKELSMYFYRLLIEPIEDRIKNRELVIVPHGALHYIPFQALYDGEHYLIEKTALSYAPSLTMLHLIERKKYNTNNRALILGNPTMNLESAEEESRRISGLMPNSDLLIGKLATKSYLKEKGADYEWIHIASHATYDSAEPLNSGFLLANDENSRDGFVSARELFSIGLKANLVTVSACESGLSKNKSGDELIGLQRALFFAGTRSIVSSLWEVSDRATRDLMTSFYSNLTSNHKSKALQQAQIETMKKYPEPFYWAAFDLIGARD